MFDIIINNPDIGTMAFVFFMIFFVIKGKK
jgi:hypothetical protein